MEDPEIDEELTKRRDVSGEHRLPPIVAVLVAAASYALLIGGVQVGLTKSSASSPTDTMPRTSRAKALMGVESTAALLVSLLVIARAVRSSLLRWSGGSR